MAAFGELVLVVGDYHIPERASDIPDKFKRMLVPNKMQHVICTGNVGQEHFEELRALAPNVHVVAGDCDMNNNNGSFAFPEELVVQVGQFRIGVTHGHQIIPWKNQDALARMRRKLNVDVLISGHTHQNEVVCHEGHYHLNPGSITGAYSALTPTVIPSFILLAVKDDNIVCYVYEFVNDAVEVSKTEFSKATMTSESNPALLSSLLS